METKRHLRGSGRFQEGETALCYEPDPSKARMLYEVKIVEMESTKDTKGKKIMEYFVHFIGWNKNWDRWVPDDSILKDVELNRDLQRNLLVSNSKSKNARRCRTSDMLDVSSPIQSSDSSFHGNETIIIDPLIADKPKEKKHISLEIPSCLKLKLEEDCYKIKRKKLLVTLPRCPSARDILDDYVKQMEMDKSQSRHLVEEFVEGLMTYFNFTIGTLLLYNYEQEQYKTLFPNKTDTKVKQEPMSPADVKTGHHKNEARSPRPKRRRKSTTSTSSSSECGKEGTEGDSKRRSLRPRTSLVFYTWDKYGIANIGNSAVCESEADNHEDNNKEIPTSEETTSKPTIEPSPAVTINEINITSIPSYIGTTKSPIEIYGAEHLSRLFVRLPSLIARTQMEENKLKVLLDFLGDFMAFISTRSSQYFHSSVYKEIEPL